MSLQQPTWDMYIDRIVDKLHADVTAVENKVDGLHSKLDDGRTEASRTHGEIWKAIAELALKQEREFGEIRIEQGKQGTKWKVLTGALVVVSTGLVGLIFDALRRLGS